MSFTSIPGGWRDRAKKVREVQDARDAAAEIRAERARLAEEHRLLSELQAAENITADEATICVCPACDTGRVSVQQAERIIRALERLPSDSRPDPAVLSYLASVAKDVVAPGTARAPRKLVHTHYPRAVEPIAPAQSVQMPVSAKDKVRRTDDPRTTEDGALIEV
ncbi:hypothetical protein U8607_02505 [Methylobacterium durans]|uniref:hypothetical protein n=1 Tax=Methylobacterium durans TaxID=2202825 RepID=UPI002AFE3F84|nr:hypothetical protein [Methylobacterium durans]MEA1830942.1 hypothetical protein [Methylobacterium durans]